MLDQISRAKAVVNAGVIAISLAVAVALDHKLAVPLHNWSSAVAIFAVSLGAIAFDYLAHQLTDSSKIVRKALCGDDYIEGTWVEVYQSRDVEGRALSVLQISCD
jgi:hypothetical protein